MDQRLPILQYFNGEITVPCSKSYAQRAIALAALHKNETRIKGITFSKDVVSAIEIIMALGAVIEKKEREIIIQKGIGLNNGQSPVIHCGESGLNARLFSAFSLLTSSPFIVKGEGSILNRKMKMVIDGLQQFGKRITSNGDHLPFIIEGKTKTGTIIIDGSNSSQFLSGLLLVAPFLKEKTIMHVPQLNSKPYISITLEVAKSFGLQIRQHNWAQFEIEGNQNIQHVGEYLIEGDWSAASIFIVAGAMGGTVRLKGLKENSVQGDRQILDIVQQAGAKVTWEQNTLVINKNALNAFTCDATDCPDLFPALAVLAAFCKGTSIIKGVGRLENKESNRGIALQKECAKAGVNITIQDDDMIIAGGINISKETLFYSHHDHRIAMAMSLFSLKSAFPIIIRESEAVEKSYPGFFCDFLACANHKPSS